MRCGLRVLRCNQAGVSDAETDVWAAFRLFSRDGHLAEHRIVGCGEATIPLHSRRFTRTWEEGIREAIKCKPSIIRFSPRESAQKLSACRINQFSRLAKDSELESCEGGLVRHGKLLAHLQRPHQ